MPSPLVLGIDLGGTQLRVALIDGAGQIFNRVSAATDVAGGPTGIIAQILKLAEELGLHDMRGGIIAAGACAPGPLDSVLGHIIEIPTLPGWRDFPLRRVLETELAIPVELENDGIAAAFGEWKFGAGKGLRNLVYVTVSTGIGGGIVVDDRLLHGRRGMAGHVGHFVMDQDGPRCSCGAHGCFEAIASGTALGIAAKDSGFSSAPAMVEAARNGNVRALELLHQEAGYLGRGFSSLLHLFSPERLIMGGGVSQAIDLMLPRIRECIEQFAMPPFRSVEVVPAMLGDNAGLIGAAMLSYFKNYRA